MGSGPVTLMPGALRHFTLATRHKPSGSSDQEISQAVGTLWPARLEETFNLSRGDALMVWPHVGRDALDGKTGYQPTLRHALEPLEHGIVCEHDFVRGASHLGLRREYRPQTGQVDGIGHVHQRGGALGYPLALW